MKFPWELVSCLMLNFNKSVWDQFFNFSCYHGFVGLKSIKLQCVSQLRLDSEILSSKLAKTTNLYNFGKIYFTIQLADTGLTSYFAEIVN